MRWEMIVARHVLEELLLNGEVRPASFTSALPSLFDGIDVGFEIVHHMGRIGRCTDGGDGLHLRDVGAADSTAAPPSE
jgi:hypothetical protein